MKNYKKNILISGGLGFIGINLSIKLASLGNIVTIVDLNKKTPLQNTYKNIKIINKNINDKHLLKKLITKNDIFFHLVGDLDHYNSLAYPFRNLKYNAELTLKILEVARVYNNKIKIIFPSSRLVYGKALYLPVDEKHPTNPMDLYATHKLLSEKYLQIYYNNFNIPFTIFRIPNIYGQNKNKINNKYNIVNYFLELAIKNKTIEIFDHGKQKRDYIYIDDLINALMLGMTNSKTTGMIFNLGSKKPVSLKTMVESIIKITKTGKIKYCPWPQQYKKNETGDYYSDYKLFTDLTKWKPKIDILSGIKKTHKYYESQK